jgi:hypothetical protein
MEAFGARGWARAQEAGSSASASEEKTRPGDEAKELPEGVVEKAVKLLAKLDPAFRADDFRATLKPTADGRFDVVTFTRTSGTGPAECKVTIARPPAPTRTSADPALASGKLAPTTEGVDVEGRATSLADYRGKAVLLVFCIPRCPPCVSFYEEGKKLVKTYEGRPFAVVEIMGNATRDEARKVVADAQLPWPVIWEGDPDDGSLQDRWKVDRFPSFWLVDHEGRLVASSDQARGRLEETVAEAEAALRSRSGK